MTNDSNGETRHSLTHNIGELFVRRRRPRTSGGVPTNGRHDADEAENADTPADFGLSDVAKGKRKAVNGDLVPPKAQENKRHRLRQSVGNSPLATEVTNAKSDGAEEPDRSRAGSQVHAANANSYAANARLSGESGVPDSERPVRGYDTDPTQIVNLALSLNESRRRNVSGSSFLATRTSSSNRRLTSYGQPTLGPPHVTHGGSLRQHLQQQRYGDRNASPRSTISSGSRGRQSASQDLAGNRRSSFLPNPELEQASTPVFDVSDATLARAARAKESFELMYEYRRLLQDLPELDERPSNRQSSRRVSKNENDTEIDSLGRTYNPLQYVRNRKVRLRERRPLTAEADGWKDVDKVRAWVDLIRTEREDGISHVDDPLPLPPFATSQAQPTFLDNVQTQNATQQTARKKQHPGRPRSDWTIYPWDLLADAHWLDQDDNIAHIEDSNGHKVFDRGVSRQKTSTRHSRDSARSAISYASLPDARKSPERRRMNRFRGKNARKEQSRHRSKTTETDSAVDDQGRKARWTRGFIRSREASLSDGSDSEGRRNPKPANRTDRDHLDNMALERQMLDMLATEEPEAQHKLDHQKPSPLSQANAVDRSLESSPKAEISPQSPKQRPKPPQRLKTDMPVGRRTSSPPRTSFDDQLLRHRRMSSDDFDSTEPSSPTTLGFVPSIAINFSPPTGPSATTASPKRPSPSSLGAFRSFRSPNSSKPAISDHDFGSNLKASPPFLQRDPRNFRDNELRKVGTANDATNQHLSPVKSRTLANEPHLHESKSLRSLRDTNEPESRFRSFLKAGKVADLVGNQVSRASDMLRRKDRGRDPSAPPSPTFSHASLDTDGDEADISALESSANISRVTTNNDSFGRTSRAPARVEKPKYFMDNLPSFRSPGKDGEQSPISPNASPVLDPIHIQQQTQRERSRSSRFDRLAPPKIDMRSLSPSPSPLRGRRSSRDSDDQDSRSVSRAGSRVSSHTRLNDILDIPGKFGTGPQHAVPITGLARLEAQPGIGEGRPTLEGKRHWSMADREAVQFDAVTIPNIARVRALLLSSGVKANEIARKANELPEDPPKLLKTIENVIDAPSQRASQAQEHVIAARLLISSIENSNNKLRDAESRFSTVTFANLQKQARCIDERINTNITPLVRDTADDADNFSTALTTTHTLSVKELNDQVDLILRRRRQRSRWLRRGGWATLEWMVLGTMWMVWFIVMIIQLVKGTFATGFRIVKWLLWM